jgi:outer membrane lipoprotein SlyB
MTRTRTQSTIPTSSGFRWSWIVAGVFAISSPFSMAAELQSPALTATTQQFAMQTAGPVCAICGTVESVKEAQRESAPSGLGALAGAALGGWIANQVGSNDGKTLATIVGLLGGMWAGNAAEKQIKKETVYAVAVRMEDGSLQTLEQSSPIAVGTHVTVEGSVIVPMTTPAVTGAGTSV